MKQIAWYDPTNGMVSTDKDSPLFTPLGQVWPLYLPRTWTGLTDEEIEYAFRTNSVIVDNGNAYMVAGLRAVNITRAIEAKLKEKNNV